MFRCGLLAVVCGPSGVGKGTILKMFKEKNENIRFSISATTREPRQGEIDGVNYFFTTVDEFKEMIEKDKLVEWVEYCGNYYGTPKKYIEESINEGYDVVLEIEVEGAANLKKVYPEIISIFILPPSFNELHKRIEARGTEAEDIIQKRLARARTEMAYINNYDYVIINDKIEQAVNDLNCIFLAEKLKLERNNNILNHIGAI